MSQETGTADMKSSLGHRSSSDVYAHSFGALAHKSRYVDGWANTDLRTELKSRFEVGLKAIGTTTGGAGTAGTSALVPVYVDPRIVDRSRKETPLVELIPRVTNQGLTADYNVITAKGSAFTANPDAALNESDDTYDRQSKAVKFVYAVGRVLGPSQASIPPYMLQGFQPAGAGLGPNTFSEASAPNARQLEILMKARQLKEKEEDLILNGDSSSDSTEYDGIITQQSTTNQVDLGGRALEWNDVETAITEAYKDGGRPKLAVASPSALQQLRRIAIDTLRVSGDQLTAGVQLPFGIPPQLVLHTSVGPIPVLPSRFLSDTAGARQIWFLDTDVIEMRVLQDMTFEQLAKTNDSDKFMLKVYETLIVRAPQFNSYIDNIE